MQEQNGENKLQKWMKNASQQKMNKITENKKYIKDAEKKTLVNTEEFMIEIDLLDSNQERLLKISKASINKRNKKFFSKLEQEQEKKYDEEVNQEEQKQENQIKIDSCIKKRQKDCQDLSNSSQTFKKVMIIQDDSDEKQTENTNPVISAINGSLNYTNQVSKEQKESQNDQIDQFKEMRQGNITEEQLAQKLESQRLQYENQLQKMKQQKHPKIQIQQNVNPQQPKKTPVMIVDAFMQTDDTSDIHGQEILNLIILEQNTVYQLNQLHEKILRLLNNQI